MSVFNLIIACLQLSLPCTPELALLGMHDVGQRPRNTKLLISYLLYYAKKEILLKWASPFPFHIILMGIYHKQGPAHVQVDIYL